MWYLAGNWKMNHGPAAAEAFFKELKTNPLPARSKSGRDLRVVVIPQLPLISFCLEQAQVCGIKVGAQNCAAQESGAFTGETSAHVLAELRVSYTLIGHSERRTLFGETDEILNRKLHCALKAKITPIFCVGETLGERESGRTFEVLDRQLKVGLAGVKAGPLVLAYEPVWAIGTGKVASPEQAQEAHAHIRAKLHELELAQAGESEKGLNAARTPLLYGGSVKPENASALGSQPDLDGFLVGGASLQAASFLELIRLAP